MNNPQLHFSRKIFWAIILLGLVLPWIVRMGTEIFFHPDRTERVLAEFPKLLFAPGRNLFLLGILNAIPFIIFAFLTRWRYRISAGQTPNDFFPHKTGVIGAGLVTIGLSLGIHLFVWIPIFGPGHAASTSVILFMLLPFYSLASMPAGYLFGWLVGKLMKK